MRRLRRSSWLLFGCALTVATVLLVFVFPTSTLLAQRRDRSEVVSQLRRITNENRLFETRIRQLLTRQEIERIARAKYNLVHDGEEAFAILPSRTAPSAGADPAARGTAERTGGESLWARVWSRASALF